jgi:hypothetical protein
MPVQSHTPVYHHGEHVPDVGPEALPALHRFVVGHHPHGPSVDPAAF